MKTTRPFVLAAVVAILASAGLAESQFAYIPDNMPTVGGANSWPLNFSSTSGRFQQYLDSQFLPTQPVKVTDVAFARAASNPSTFRATLDFQLRMSHTNTGCSPPNTFVTNIAPVPTELISTTSGNTYSAPTQNAWSDFGIVQPFGYDGMRNITLEIRYRGQLTSLGFTCRSASIPRIWANSTSADNFVATNGTRSCTGGLKTRLTYTTKNVLIAPDTVKVGAPATIQMFGLNPGSFYRLAASFGDTPLPLGSCTLYLALDDLFRASINVGAPLFNNYANVIPASGKGTASLAVPGLAVLVGVPFYHAAVTFDSGGLNGCTNTAGTMIIP